MYTEEVIVAIKEIADKYISKRIIFLNESDLKVALANKIKEKFSSNITVNTESPWYDIYETNRTYFVDITAFDENKLHLTYDPQSKRKGYKYDDEALVIELKYFRYEADIVEIIKDFEKTRLLIKAPKNECFIVAFARTIEIFNNATELMIMQTNFNKIEFNKKVKIFLVGPEEISEFK